MASTPELRYEIGVRDPAAEARLAAELGCSPLLAAALRARGYDDPAAADAYLHPDLNSLGDPETLPDFPAAAAILLAAREAKELVFVHGDYDCDGVSSAALFHRFLTAAGWNVHTFTPDRLKHGYGVHIESVLAAKQMGAKVLLTCDCGISAGDSLAVARDAGMRVIVTDHHLPQASRPFVHALVDPHLEGSRYPFSGLAGAGVVFRFCEGLARRLGMPIDRYRDRFLEFACLGTVADVMPLVSENRTIVRHALPRLAESSTPGLRELIRSARVQEINAQAIGWSLGPRINAVGRICDSAHALRLLTTHDAAEATELAAYIEGKNLERRGIQDAVQKKAFDVIEAERLYERFVIMLALDDVAPGVVGLVAGRVSERYGRPAFVLRRDPESGRLAGSARSAYGIKLHPIIEANRHLGLGGGGHTVAAGVHFEAAAFDEIYRGLEIGVQAQLPEGRFVPTIGADFQASLDELDVRSVESLRALEPCGEANKALTILAAGVRVTEAKRTKRLTSVQYGFRSERGTLLSGIRHGVSEDEPLPLPGERVDLFGQPTLNEWNGRVTVQIQVNATLPTA